MATLAVMNRLAKAFFDVARCEDVYTSSKLGKGKPLHPRRRKVQLRRQSQLHVRTATSDAAKWKAEARRLGLTLSNLVRAKMNDTEVKFARVTAPALFREVRRQGINLNQLLHLAQAGMPVDQRLLDAALAAFIALYTRMLKEYD